MRKCIHAAAVVILCAAAVRADEAALLAAALGGSIEERPWGYVIKSTSGNTHVMRRADGYAVTTPKQTYFLSKRHGGYSLVRGKKNVRELPPDAVFDITRRR